MSKEKGSESKDSWETDIENIGDDVVDVFSGIGDSLESLGGENKVTGFFGGLISATGSAIKATVGVAGLTVKAGIKTVVVAAEAKRIIVDGIQESLVEIEKEELEEEYEKKLQSILNKNNRSLAAKPATVAIGHEKKISVSQPEDAKKQQTNKLFTESETETLVRDKQIHSEPCLDDKLNKLVSKYEK